VRYPEGWSAASGLPSRATGSTYSYEKTNYEVLVDSPVLAGRYYRPIELSPRVTLDVFADSPDELEAKPEQIDAHKRLVDQAVKTMGSQQYDHYHFLLSISDELGGIGLEHHRSSENGVKPGYFVKWDETPPAATCCRTNIRIAGTANIAAAPISGRPITAPRPAARCSGSMRARPSSGAMSSRRARGW
jgi:hypothetical protein